MSQPLISIVTPIYNRESLIAETIRSVKEQTYPNWEMLIVDDGSTDNSWDLISEFSAQDPRIKCFRRDRLPKNANTCRNIGVQHSKGDFLLFLDSDDKLIPNTLEQRLVVAQAHPELDFWLFHYSYFSNEEVKQPEMAPPLDLDQAYNQLLQGKWCYNITSMFLRRTTFEANGRFDEQFNRFQDPDFYLRLYANKQFKGKAFPIVDAIIRVDIMDHYKRTDKYLSSYILAYSQYIAKHYQLLAGRPEKRKIFEQSILNFFDYHLRFVHPIILLKHFDKQYWKNIFKWGVNLKKGSVIAFFYIVYLAVPTRLKITLCRKILTKWN